MLCARRFWVTTAVTVITGFPAAAFAGDQLPQMDFANPYTSGQVVWMVVIMVALYYSLSRRALPAIGGIIENRRSRIAADLNAAQEAKIVAERAAAELNRTIMTARQASQAQIAEAIANAKREAQQKAEHLNARLATELARAEAAIEAARQSALAALPLIAEDVAGSLVQHLVGVEPDRRVLAKALKSARS